MINKAKISGIMCVSSGDIEYLFEYALISFLEKVNFVDEINIITPDVKLMENKILELKLNSKINIKIFADSDILSKEELELCGWSKQQIIKLKSYKICDGNILSLGADTIILRSQELKNFYSPNEIIINYRKHNDIDKHLEFEIERSKNISKKMDISFDNDSSILRDYIFDLFFFERGVLKKLDEYLSNKFGINYFLKVFPKSINGYEDMVKTGEWTIYALFVIKKLMTNYKLQDAGKIVHQIHSLKNLELYDYSNDVIHFVRKDFDKKLIFSKIKVYLKYYENTDN